VSARIGVVIWWDVEIRERARHLEGLGGGHRLTGQVSKCVVDRLAFGGQLVAHHHTMDEGVVDVDIGPRHVENVHLSGVLTRSLGIVGK